jgi:hypothetical protein
MVPPLTPEQAKGWLDIVLAIMERGGPVSLLIALGTSAVLVWIFLGEMRHLRADKAQVYQQLIAAQQAHMELARTCAPSQ